MAFNTESSARMKPHELVEQLDGCFSHSMKREPLWSRKAKTIGDAYMCAAGLPKRSKTHAIDACLAALEFRTFMLQMAQIKRSLGQSFWKLRIGIRSGPVTAGVIGTNKFAYDIWGDTVNTASRMESSGKADMINISGITHEMVREFFMCQHRGQIEAKGKGRLDMYFLQRLNPGYSRDPEGLMPNSAFFQRRAEIANSRT